MESVETMPQEQPPEAAQAAAEAVDVGSEGNTQQRESHVDNSAPLAEEKPGVVATDTEQYQQHHHREEEIKTADPSETVSTDPGETAQVPPADQEVTRIHQEEVEASSGQDQVQDQQDQVQDQTPPTEQDRATSAESSPSEESHTAASAQQDQAFREENGVVDQAQAQQDETLAASSAGVDQGNPTLGEQGEVIPTAAARATASVQDEAGLAASAESAAAGTADTTTTTTTSGLQDRKRARPGDSGSATSSLSYKLPEGSENQNYVTPLRRKTPSKSSGSSSSSGQQQYPPFTDSPLSYSPSRMAAQRAASLDGMGGYAPSDSSPPLSYESSSSSSAPHRPRERNRPSQGSSSSRRKSRYHKAGSSAGLVGERIDYLKDQGFPFVQWAVIVLFALFGFYRGYQNWKKRQPDGSGSKAAARKGPERLSAGKGGKSRSIKDMRARTTKKPAPTIQDDKVVAEIEEVVAKPSATAKKAAPVKAKKPKASSNRNISKTAAPKPSSAADETSPTTSVPDHVSTDGSAESTTTSAAKEPTRPKEPVIEEEEAEGWQTVRKTTAAKVPNEKKITEATPPNGGDDVVPVKKVAKKKAAKDKAPPAASPPKDDTEIPEPVAEKIESKEPKAEEEPAVDKAAEGKSEGNVAVETTAENVDKAAAKASTRKGKGAKAKKGDAYGKENGHGIVNTPPANGGALHNDVGDVKKVEEVADAIVEKEDPAGAEKLENATDSTQESSVANQLQETVTAPEEEQAPTPENTQIVNETGKSKSKKKAGKSKSKQVSAVDGKENNAESTDADAALALQLQEEEEQRAKVEKLQAVSSEKAQVEQDRWEEVKIRKKKAKA